MIELEQRAVLELEAGLEHRELVAIGLINGEVTMWWELPNSAEANPDGRGEFLVEASDLADVCNGIILEVGVEAWQAMPKILWHTHVLKAGPSSEDVEEFPEWLFDAGAVYHVPSRSTILYNGSGILDSAAHSLEGVVHSDPLATVSDG